MVQPLDPTLNIPTDPDIPIEQLAYRKIPFPFDDLTNTPQPALTQLYPDNHPSVVSTTAGMHPTGNQSQVVNTDGNHAMLVHDVGGGGSNPNGNAIPNAGAFQNVFSFFSRPSGLQPMGVLACRYLYGYSLSVCASKFSNAPPTSTLFQLWIGAAGGGTSFAIEQIGIALSVAPTNLPIVISKTVLLPYPLDCETFLGPGGIDFEIATGALDVGYVTLSPIGGN